MKRIIAATTLCMAALYVESRDFSETFCDSTLRIDYVLSGKPGDVGISLRQMSKSAVWGGRRHNLQKPPYRGNADVMVTTLEGDTIYANSLSSLFSEWLDLGQDVATSSECTVLIPLPRNSVVVTTRLLDRYGSPSAIITHTADPTDILIRDSKKEPLPHRYISRATASTGHIGVAFLGEGYLPDEMEQFYVDAFEATDAILSHEPFASMADRFDFIAIETPSVDSGVSVPKNGVWKDTAFKSHYSTFYSDRYLTSPEVYAMYDALRGIPAQHIIVLVNSEEYGGGGIYNDYTLTSARHSTHRPVVVHEFGHSFGGLADEYFYPEEEDDTYPLDIEPWEPNITTLVDFSSKWQDLMADGTPMPTNVTEAHRYPVGVYEGAGYKTKGIYRPADRCRMRTNDAEGFCPVCQSALLRIIKYYTEPADK